MLLINTKHTRVAIIGMATLVFVYGADRFFNEIRIQSLGSDFTDISNGC